MRFAIVATCAAAAVAVPLALAASGPQMSEEDFVSAVRCTAVAALARPGADAGAARWRLNAEALRQSADTVAAAEAEVSAIARAAIADHAPRSDMIDACAPVTAAVAGPHEAG